MDFNITKLTTLALVIITTTFIQAQSNLVFNQVLNFNLNNGESATVPEGKAWKIEGGISTGSIIFSSVNQPYGNDLSTTNMGSVAIQTLQFPYWIGAGVTITKVGNGQNHISILEFNVVAVSSVGGGSGGGVSTDGLVFEEAITQTLTTTEISAANTHLYGEIVVPENRILKIINTSTYTLVGSGATQDNGEGYVYIGDELFLPQGVNSFQNMPRYLPSGTYTAKIVWSSNDLPSILVVNAILYSKP